MEVKAHARFAKVAVRKARVVVDLIRGKNAAEALMQLRFTKKSAAPVVAKVLDSAIANARDKDGKINVDSLFVKTAFADKAPDKFMRRWRPRAMGRATRVAKGMSHITVVLGQRTEA